MYHLEDYLDKLEHLPQEMQKRFTKIREVDVHVEQSMKDVTKSFDHLFLKADNMSPNELDQKFNAIIKKGEKAIEQSEDKIKIANSMQELMAKFLKQIDLDLHNFKMDLENKQSGITELIEKRILDSEGSHTTSQIEKKYQLNRYLFGSR